MKRVLIVLQAFDTYARGAVVDDPPEIARLLASDHADKLRETQLPTREEAEREGREQAIAEARAAPLPDAVYQLANYNSVRSGLHQIDPFELFATTPRAEIEDWLRRASKLLSDAWAVGDAYLSKDAPYEALRERFLRDNPGFSLKTYNDAEHRGTVAALH